MRQSDKERLDFSSEAAVIQRGLSSAIIEVTGLFKEIYETGDWPSGGGSNAVGWVRHEEELADAWQALRPPIALRPLWREVGVQITGLVALVKEVELLQSADQRSLLERARSLQIRFNTQLEVMTKTEGRLLAEEGRLRGAAKGRKAA